MPNTTINRNETNARKQRPVSRYCQFKFQSKNQTIVNEGSVIQPVHITILSEIKNANHLEELIKLLSLQVCYLLVLYQYFCLFATF